MEIEIEFVEELVSRALRSLPKGDEDIYTDEGIDDLEEDDEISLEESGFMRGYLGD